MAVRYDDFLNGSGAAPEYKEPTGSALPTRPSDGATDTATSSSKSTTRAVMIAWIVLFALLVLAHVITLDFQS